MVKKEAVFLDRDGVINDNRKTVNKPEDFRKPKPGMLLALAEK